MLSTRIALILASGLACAAVAQAQTPPPKFEARPPGKPGEPVKFAFAAPPGAAWAMVFYRAVGEEEFRSLPLRAETGPMVATLPAGEIGGRAIQYYVAYKVPEGVKYLPEDAPASMTALDLGAGAADPAAASRIKQRVPFQVSASLEKVFYRSQKVDGERTFFNSGQVAVGYELESGEHRLSLNTRLAYQNQPMEGQPAWSVGELHGLYAYQNHRAQIGDMAFQESEFTVGGMGRRGLDYLYDDHQFSAHFFAVGTEQLAGFRGLAWPVKGTELFGGAVGWAWMDGQVRSKFIFLTGQDDPAQGINIGAAPFVTRREGTTAALTMEAALLQSRLSLNGEYARTNYDKDLDDAVGKVQDQAWRLGGAWSERNYSFRASYRQIGRDFGTLGYPVMEGDRRSMDGGFSLNLNPSWSLNANATSERNNPNADPLETRAHNEAQTMDVQWIPAAGFTVKAGLNRGEQVAGTGADPLIPFANSKRSGVNAGMDWAPGANAALSLSAQLDKLDSTGTATTTGRSTTLTFGGAFQVPNHLRLAPTLSYTKNTEDGTGQDSKVVSAFLNADVTLIQKWLSLALNGGYNRTEAAGVDSTSTNADAALQWFLTPYMDQSFHRGQAILALRFRYTRVQTLPEPDRRASLTLNFSF